MNDNETQATFDIVAWLQAGAVGKEIIDYPGACGKAAEEIRRLREANAVLRSCLRSNRQQMGHTKPCDPCKGNGCYSCAWTGVVLDCEPA